MYQQQSYAPMQPSMQPSFVQSQYQPSSVQSQYQPTVVQSQYRPQTRFQPTGYVQSFYQGTAAPTNQGYGQSQFQPSYGQSQFTPEHSYHAANYRGDQAGHDQYLRADSVNPSGSFTGGFSQQSQYPISSFQSGISGQLGGQSGYGQTQMSGYSSAPSADTFHAANYRGNQSGHDQYLRADSTKPSQFGQFR